MPAIVWVVGGLAVVVGLLLAVDWLMAGRTRGRILARARDQSASDAGVGYAVIQNQTHGEQFDTWS